jgi:hypothetical protein
LKKLVLAVKIVYKLYNIKQGILRSGDDLYYNEPNLIEFLNSKNKPDYYGSNIYSVLNPNPEHLKKLRDDFMMVEYYSTHQEDFNNPMHNLKGVDISKYTKRPDLLGAGGNLYYISNKSCNILIDHMEKINYDIFHFDDFTNSYPYTIEDCAVTFVMYLNRISFINSPIVSISGNIQDLNFPGRIAVSTNKYK